MSWLDTVIATMLVFNVECTSMPSWLRQETLLIFRRERTWTRIEPVYNRLKKEMIDEEGKTWCTIQRLQGDVPSIYLSAPSVSPERRFDGAAPPKTVLYDERGGQIVDHWERWKALAAQGGEVEIRGPCWSACTLIMAHIPRERLCFDKRAELNFHQAMRPNGEPAMESTRWMVDQYPKDIREWIKTMGGAERLPLPSPNHPAGTFYMLFPVQLWAMGYRKCAD
jgi:hypothetical protein